MADYGTYGRGLTAKGVANTLREADDYVGSQSYWQYAEGQAESLYEGTENTLQLSYNRAINEAYASSIKQREIMNNSRLVGQGRAAYEKDISDAYQQAYESYQQSLAEGRQQNIESYQQGILSLQNQLQKRSQQFANLGEAHYNYAKYLFDTYYDNEGNTGPWSDFDWQDVFLTTDSDGTVRLKTKDELYNTSYIDEDGRRIYNSVYDENGELTEFGRRYFDILENYSYGKGETSFANWLYDTNKDLYSFAFEEPNYYDISSDGTNLGTFKELTAREADDYSYTVAEHLGGMSKGTINGYFNDINSKINEVINGDIRGGAIKETYDSFESVVTKLEDLANKLGISEDIKEEISFDEIRSAISNAKSESKNPGKMAGDFFGQVGIVAGSSAASVAAMGGTIGAVAGSIIPGAGTALGAGIGAGIGALVGAIGGFIAGVVKGSYDVVTQQNKNEALAIQIKEQLQSVIDSMVSYSIAKRDYLRNNK